MDDLVRWLGVQLDEDERIADAARGQGDGRWHHDSSYPNGYVYDEHNQPVVYDESTPSPEEAVHIAAHDPARVLREIDAKRKLLTDLLPDLQQADRSIEGEWGSSDDLAERMLRLLALPYADREGYREEWAP